MTAENPPLDTKHTLLRRLREQFACISALELWNELSSHRHLRHIAGEPDDDQWIFCEDDSPGSIFEVSLPSGADIFLRDLEILHAEGSLRSVVHLIGEDAMHLLHGYGICPARTSPYRLRDGTHPIQAARLALFGNGPPWEKKEVKAVMDRVLGSAKHYYNTAHPDKRAVIAALLDLLDPQVGTDAILRLCEQGLRQMERPDMTYRQVLIELVETALVAEDLGPALQGDRSPQILWEKKALWPELPPPHTLCGGGGGAGH